MEPAQESRREVIKQVLPSDPDQELTLIEVGYPVGTGSSAIRSGPDRRRTCTSPA